MDATTPLLPNLAARPRSTRNWKRLAWAALGIAILVYLPFVFTFRSVFGMRVSNAQLLNLGMTQINMTLISALGALSLTYLTGRGGLISIGHAALYGIGALAGGEPAALSRAHLAQSRLQKEECAGETAIPTYTLH